MTIDCVQRYDDCWGGEKSLYNITSKGKIPLIIRLKCPSTNKWREVIAEELVESVTYTLLKTKK